MSRLGRLCLLSCLLFAVPPAVAQDAGEDGGALQVPDGSVGEGGADRESPEQNDSTGRVATHCASPGDCSRGFSCQQGRCVYTGVREAEGGCLLGVQAALFLGGLVVVTRNRRIKK